MATHDDCTPADSTNMTEPNNENLSVISERNTNNTETNIENYLNFPDKTDKNEYQSVNKTESKESDLFKPSAIQHEILKDVLLERTSDQIDNSDVTIYNDKKNKDDDKAIRNLCQILQNQDYTTEQLQPSTDCDTSLNVQENLTESDNKKEWNQKEPKECEIMKYRSVYSDSSSEASSDDSSSSSSSFSSEDESESSEETEPTVESSKSKVFKKRERDNDGDEDDDDDNDDDDNDRTGKHPETPPGTKGEIRLENMPPIEDLAIEVGDSVVMQEVGHVASTVGTLVIVQANRSLPALNEESVLFLDGKKVLGQIFEVFGPVPAPLYSVRFNSVNDISEKGIVNDMPVFYAPQEEWLTNYVFVEQLRRMKGTDASWEHNNEPPDKYRDFSDDEEERKAKAKRRGRDPEEMEKDTQQGCHGKKRKPRQRKPQASETLPYGTGTQRNSMQGGRGPYNTPPFNRNPFDHMHYGVPQMGNPAMFHSQSGFHGYRGNAPRGFMNRGPCPPRFGQFPTWRPRHGHPLQQPQGFIQGFAGDNQNMSMYRNGPPEYHWYSNTYTRTDTVSNGNQTDTGAGSTLSDPHIPVVDSRLMNNMG